MALQELKSDTDTRDTAEKAFDNYKDVTKQAGLHVARLLTDTRKKEINTVLSNSFGFGGTNASLIFRRVDS